MGLLSLMRRLDDRYLSQDSDRPPAVEDAASPAADGASASKWLRFCRRVDALQPMDWRLVGLLVGVVMIGGGAVVGRRYDVEFQGIVAGTVLDLVALISLKVLASRTVRANSASFDQ